MNYINQFKSLKYKSKFSMKEIIPVLENKMSETLNYEVVIRPWICDFENMSEAKMYYIAIPKCNDNGIQVSFTINNKTYIYETIDEKHDHYYQANKDDIIKMKTKKEQLKNLINDGLAFIITEKNIKKSDIILTLVSDSKEEYHLFNGLFTYSEQLDFLNSTIEDFAKQKIKTPTK